MTLVLELPSELETELATEAAHLGLPLANYVLQLLTEGRNRRTGAQLVAYWQAEGLIGTRPETVDAPVHARALREQAQRRARS